MMFMKETAEVAKKTFNEYDENHDGVLLCFFVFRPYSL